jgi:hypothetical protein
MTMYYKAPLLQFQVLLPAQVSRALCWQPVVC